MINDYIKINLNTATRVSIFVKFRRATCYKYDHILFTRLGKVHFMKDWMSVIKMTIDNGGKCQSLL